LRNLKSAIPACHRERSGEAGGRNLHTRGGKFLQSCGCLSRGASACAALGKHLFRDWRHSSKNIVG